MEIYIANLMSISLQANIIKKLINQLITYIDCMNTKQKINNIMSKTVT